MKKTYLLTILFSIIFLSGCGSVAPDIQTKDSVVNQKEVVETKDVEPVQDIQGEPQVENKNNQEFNSINLTEEKPMESEEKQVSYTAVLHTTEGDITIKFNDDQTPKTVENFITLAKKDFYNDTIFHRVLKGFMIQGGDPQGTGMGGPGYKFDDEPFEGEYERGTVAMANSGPNTNGSQFFIMHADYALPKNYVIFGTVTDGMDTVDKIAQAKVEMSFSGEPSAPVSPVKIKTIEISGK